MQLFGFVMDDVVSPFIQHLACVRGYREQFRNMRGLYSTSTVQVQYSYSTSTVLLHHHNTTTNKARVLSDSFTRTSARLTKTLTRLPSSCTAVEMQRSSTPPYYAPPPPPRQVLFRSFPRHLHLTTLTIIS